MSVSAFGLTPNEFWTDPNRTEDEVIDRLGQEGFEGVRIDAPSFVPLDVRDTLPLLAVRAGSYRDMYSVDYTQHALLTAVDLDSNRVYVSLADESEYDRVRSDEPVDIETVPEGRLSSFYVLDARERLGLPWHPARYLVTVVLRERISNRFAVELGRSPGAFRDPAIDAYLAEERAKAQPRALYPPAGNPYPKYEPIDGCPPSPVGSGVSFVLPTAAVQGDRWLLQGSFRFKLEPDEIVKSWPKDDPNPPSAICRITFLITGGDHASPLRFQALVPSYERLDPTDAAPNATAPIATGCFSIDLAEMPGVPRKAQTYFVYAFHREILVGPVTTSLIEPEGAPGR